MVLKFKDFLSERISQKELDMIEAYADELFRIDIEFTKHFFERVNDKRNGKDITTEELKDMFDKLFRK